MYGPMEGRRRIIAGSFRNSEAFETFLCGVLFEMFSQRIKIELKCIDFASAIVKELKSSQVRGFFSPPSGSWRYRNTALTVSIHGVNIILKGPIFYPFSAHYFSSGTQ